MKKYQILKSGKNKDRIKELDKKYHSVVKALEFALENLQCKPKASPTCDSVWACEAHKRGYEALRKLEE